MYKSAGRLVHLDGELVPYEEAKVHILTPAVKYGASVFEGICGYATRDGGGVNIFRLREHLIRLQQSMHILRYDRTYSLEELTEVVLDTVRANDVRTDSHIRLQAHVLGEGLMGACGPVGLSCTVSPRESRAIEDRTKRAQVTSWRRIDDASMPPRVKAAANYHNGRLGTVQARADGYDEPIFLTQAGKVSESGGACLFILRDGVPITPSVTQGILESVTRDTMLRIFAEVLERRAAEREIDRTELYIADEAFLCGSAYEVSPVVNVDGMDVGAGGIGEITRAVWDTYEAVVRGATNVDPAWLTPVFDD
ncbi:MAG: branched-chain-amino-acid transaminase [Rhodospirillaceae bacterium]|jgi:branched-chain amino acid aminotransferase|nr:branched-chain-amino-acid transaminase [Rhodospirillaceae bacterium]MBT6116323.1 branched-chain-amino-acid transaminase [Rhodospirillaceae bacterium]